MTRHFDVITHHTRHGIHKLGGNWWLRAHNDMEKLLILLFSTRFHGDADKYYKVVLSISAIFIFKSKKVIQKNTDIKTQTKSSAHKITTFATIIHRQLDVVRPLDMAAI